MTFGARSHRMAALQEQASRQQHAQQGLQKHHGARELMTWCSNRLPAL
jgi:hypothetical protein